MTTEEKLQKLLDAMSIEYVELQDLNEIYKYDEFQISGVQVVVWLTHKQGICYQVSRTGDCGAISSHLEANYESGAMDIIDAIIRKNGLSEEEIDDGANYKFAEMIAKKCDLQKLFNEYTEQFGKWEHSGAMDANSEIFIKTIK